MRTTANFAPGNPFLTWYLGGLNYQIEHHLFPKVCHVHYPSLSPIVSATCQEYGIPYRSHPTLREALTTHLRWLRQLGVHTWPLLRTEDPSGTEEPALSARAPEMPKPPSNASLVQ